MRLATCNLDGSEHPRYFEGRFLRPQRVAKLLLGLSEIVRSRFHMPDMLIPKDPVVTCSDDRLRFEGFSGCCGVYVRLDLLPEALRGERLGRGTTNVDFNQPMLSALAKIRQTDEVGLSVGSEAVEIRSGDSSVVEKKVSLPLRWLNGFVEVQACQARMTPVFEVSSLEGVRFLRSLPRMKTNRRETWIAAAGRGLRLSQLPPRGATARVGGMERLRVLEGLIPMADQLRIFKDEITGATAWVLNFEDCQFHLVLSPEVWRGFSGEGQALTSLATREWEDALTQVQAQLTWHSVIDPQDLAKRADCSEKAARQALAVLGARGLVGFDLQEASYFHRVLPFEMERVWQMQPRLKAAQKLIDDSAVRIARADKKRVEAYVKSSGVEHRVILTGDETATCTCPWYAQYQGDRGACKHELAVRMTLEERDQGGQS